MDTGLVDTARFFGRRARRALCTGAWICGIACGAAAAGDPAVESAGPTSIERHGVTWTFEKAHSAGQFVNGDWWVVGPVAVVGIEPRFATLPDGRTVNGSMLNPAVKGETGFDSRAPSDRRGSFYKPELNVALGVGPEKPLVLSAGSSLLSSISDLEPVKERSLKAVSILTVLDAPPPPDAFRPPYVAVDKTVRHRLAQIDVARLPRLAVVGSPPSWDEARRIVERPCIDFAPNWNRYHVNPTLHRATYGRDLSRDVGLLTTLLIADFPAEEKRDALVGLVQMGIDFHGIFTEWSDNRTERSFPWNTDGGHSSGRKWPILFAGAMLGDEAMLGVMSKASGSWHEDAQTVYITQAHIDATNHDGWKPPYDGKNGKQPYSQAMLGMPEWVGGMKPESANAHWTGHPYRRAGNQHAFHGMALGVLAMGLREAWGHDAWFDYQTRYVAIMDGEPDPFAALLGYEPVEGSVGKEPWPAWQRYWNGNEWPYRMWKAHWGTYHTPTRTAGR